MDGETEEAFSQRRHTNGQEVHEKMLNITNHQGMQIKTTMRYPLAPIRMDFIKNTRRNKCWWSCGVRESSCTVGGNVNWYATTEKWYRNSFTKIEVPCDLALPLLSVYLEEMKAESWRNICTSMFIAVLFEIAKIWKRC